MIEKVEGRGGSGKIERVVGVDVVGVGKHALDLKSGRRVREKDKETEGRLARKKILCGFRMYNVETAGLRKCKVIFFCLLLNSSHGK